MVLLLKFLSTIGNSSMFLHIVSLAEIQTYNEGATRSCYSRFNISDCLGIQWSYVPFVKVIEVLNFMVPF